jgi:hypothetical protein
MILEGSASIAPLGPEVDEGLEPFVFEPFRTALTFGYLEARGEGVFHVTDDVLLLARTALGVFEPLPEMVPARRITGWLPQDACRAHELRATTIDADQYVLHAGCGDYFMNGAGEVEAS